MEIERKWRLEGKVKAELKVLEECEIFQGYINNNPEVRVRMKRYADGRETFKLTLKGDGNISREEVDFDITEDDFDTILAIGKVKRCQLIHKDYVSYEYGQYKFETSTVDAGSVSEFSYAEVEFETEEGANNFVVPSWVGLEVTYDEKYKMKNYWKLTRCTDCSK